MEKDYFKDRPIESTKINEINIGDEVFICTKLMQPYAQNLNDLSRGKVVKILTKHDHPRGIKVMINQSSNGMILTGRVTYLIKNDLILTKDGFKKENAIK